MQANNTTEYRVAVYGMDWDSRGQCFTAGPGEMLHRSADLQAAKAAFLEEWAKREEHAASYRSPIEVELCEVTTDEDGDEQVESYSAEPAPNGDASWHSFYAGEDRDGWYVLWATRQGNGHEKPYNLKSFDTIGYAQKRSGYPTGEWALRHCPDHAGSIYAEALFKTPEELAAYFHAEVDDRWHTPDMLNALAELFVNALGNSSLGELGARYERDGQGRLWARVALPDGTPWELEAPSDYEGALEHETFHVFDQEGQLYAIHCGGVPEKLLSNA